MAELLSLQTLLTYLTLISVPVGVFYHIMTLRNTRKNQELQLETRRLQFFMELAQEGQSEEYLMKSMELYQLEWNNYDEFERKFGSDKNIENFATRYEIWYFYNRVGWLLHEGIIDIETVNAFMSQFALWMWDKFESVIIKQREIYNVPDFCVWFEYLVRELELYRKEKGISTEVHKGYGSYLKS